MPGARRPLMAALVLAGLVLAGCASADVPAGTPPTGDSGPPADAQELTGDLTVFAAASLGSAFDELATQFEQRHPQVDVLPISYDGSSTLATQLLEGAPADVFASADETNMRKVVDAGLAADPALFASNTLVIAVPKGNPGGVKVIEDLAVPGLTVVLCAPEVPCGAASQSLLAGNEVDVTPASLEQNVTAVLTKVAAGEADAGLVYTTDVRGRDDVQAVQAAGAEEVVNRYPIAALGDASNPDAAAAFADFVLSAAGRAVLGEFGFGAP
ncbi:molybdate ABC transporter substrate-binding protein [Microbacterium sulfonylureivorans]|uniref:molybdate ABC transporter substrate-binding protein n=1 Tax=Microbacterium sulfonylureivorans TaxID=2486854 RepID=UPI0013E088B0|nr:molybdate ABC transporter substrate-binding protein [Microbacterium sulfonylureivorans]